MGEPTKDSTPVHSVSSFSLPTAAEIISGRLEHKLGRVPTPDEVEAELQRGRDEQRERERQRAEAEAREIAEWEARKKAKARKEATGHAVNWYSKDDVKHDNPGAWSLLGIDMVRAMKSKFANSASAWAVMMGILAYRRATGDNVGLLTVSKAKLAAELGMEPKHVYREIARLVHAGLILRRGRDIYVMGPE
ncbi:MAG: helix-turn-helix domain-containing protein [Mycobacterium sp.]